MKIQYFDEKRNKKDWDTLKSKGKYADVNFQAINGGAAMDRGANIVCFIHFRARGQQASFVKDFNFHILGKDYEVPEDATVIFGPDRPNPILKMDFNTYLRKHKAEFAGAHLVTIKRNDKVATSAMHGYNACKQFLDRRLNERSTNQ